MVAVLDYCGQLPAAIFYPNERMIHDDAPSGLIIAHREDDGDVFGKDFICRDEAEAFKKLRAAAEIEYPGIKIINRAICSIA